MSKPTTASTDPPPTGPTVVAVPVSTSTYGFSERRFTETYGEKAIRKCKENPIVPIGALATTTALIMASTKLRRQGAGAGTGANLDPTRASKQFQFWLRARVVFQALTILAVCGSAYVFGQSNLEENQRALEVHREMVNSKAERERREFDERMREAERVQEEEEELGRVLARRRLEREGAGSVGVGSGWWPWRSTSTPKLEVVSKLKTEREVAPCVLPPSPPSPEYRSWRSWLGGTQSKADPSHSGKKE
ncbi:hypothetical protein E1B28_009184 [Marasmius oreades]|uniref:HIG1 domain-containing protein n=1 Tax=Marasmius oreades TaxID=181124 RepID=A0A9P7S0J2_9AGAR|nr:uncharacterized protein E1B28_009184 [Marasmius oreades]KAG7092872.1 hypothetical protein E1B28_009184 [Marasmius oreades]